jgi:hypothetical protein
MNRLAGDDWESPLSPGISIMIGKHCSGPSWYVCALNPAQCAGISDGPHKSVPSGNSYRGLKAGLAFLAEWHNIYAY